jgi:hypothetical protein
MNIEREPDEVEDTSEVRVGMKKEMIFTIPINTKRPAEVRQSIEVLIKYMED